MCAISGLRIFKNDSVDESLISRMRDTMIHRGPDAAGLYVSDDKKVGFGFRRLAIIDLAPVGNQPMSNEDGTVWIVFNGEIYNFQPLRDELIQKGHQFKSHSDTEVIIHLYEEKGEKCLDDLNGMFAFVIWDSKKKTLFGARDRLGIKPLYYYKNDDFFTFASEIKAILEHPEVKRDVNEEALYHYLTFATTPAPLTLFSDIYKLPAGHCFTLKENGSFKEREYWSVLDYDKKSEDLSEDEYIKESKSLLGGSINAQMASDVPFGCFLSGGIDSSTNAALMSKALGKPVETFSIGFKGVERYNELEYSRKIADFLGAKKHEVLVGEDDLMEFLPKFAYHSDELNGDWVCFPVFGVSKLIRESGVIMAQVGEGADELFCGYGHYLMVLDLWKKWWKKLEKLPSFIKKTLYFFGNLIPRAGFDLHKEMLRRLANNEELFWGGAAAFSEFDKQKLVSRKFRDDLKKKGVYSSYGQVKKHYDAIDKRLPKADFLQRMTYLELNLRLPELLLMRVDRMSMANSIEARVPFLDHKLAELAFAIPMDLKTKNGISKYILKQAVRGVIPDEIIDRKKQGFGAPVSEWLRGGLKEKLTAIIFNSKLKDRGYFDYDFVQKLINDHVTQRADNSFKIWNLITLSLWYDKWIAK